MVPTLRLSQGCAPSTAGRVATLETFKHEVVGPFLLSAQDWTEACKVRP